MTPDQIAKSYDQLAYYWDSDQFNRANGIEQHKRAIEFASEKKVALDIGCGSSGRLIDLLLESGFSVEGIDISQEMINRAEKRHPDVRFYCADICAWDFDKRYSFITAWDSIWHLDIKRQERVLRKVCEALDTGGVFIFTAGAVDEPTEHSDAFFGQNLFYGVLGIPRLLDILKECGLGLRHLEYDQYPEKHLYLIAQKI